MKKLYASPEKKLDKYIYFFNNNKKEKNKKRE